MQPTRLLLALVLAGSACTTPAKDAASTQAAVAPPIKAIPDDPIDQGITIAQGYSLVTAMMVNKDARSIVGMYVPDATLILPDTTVHNAPAIAARWVEFAQSKSLADFQRSSVRTTVLDDSTLADTGSYLMTLKRTAQDSVLERGLYTARWRARPGTGTWVILEDHIMPAAKSKKGAR